MPMDRQAAARIRTHRDLDVYVRAFEAACEIQDHSMQFPREEMYSLTDQIRKSSRSVCANIAEAWRKRRYEGSFISKLSDSEGEAGETQCWIEFAVKFGYIKRDAAARLYKEYDAVINTIVGMINHPQTWVLDSGLKSKSRRNNQANK